MDMTNTRRALLASAAALVVAPHAAAKVAAPRIGELKRAPRTPYDETADAEADVRAAADRARAKGKLLLIDLGGNWCPDCRILAGIMELPEAKAFLGRHYEIVAVDIGHMDKNLQIPARYGMGTLKGVPAVIVVTPKGKVLNAGDAFVLANARTMSSQAVMDQLARWVP